MTHKDNRRECPHCGRVTDNLNETTCTACGYTTREIKKVVTKNSGKGKVTDSAVDTTEVTEDLENKYTMSVEEAAKALNKAGTIGKKVLTEEDE